MYACNIAARKMYNINFSRQIFEKSSIKFHENSAGGSRGVPRGETDTQERG
jgi:hypothetical protein